MTVLKDMPISFPGLFGDWEFNPDPIAIHVGHGIYWYGIILAAAMLAGLRRGLVFFFAISGTVHPGPAVGEARISLSNAVFIPKCI